MAATFDHHENSRSKNLNENNAEQDFTSKRVTPYSGRFTMPEHMPPALEHGDLTNMSLSEIRARVDALKGESNFAEARILLTQAIEESPGDLWLTQ